MNPEDAPKSGLIDFKKRFVDALRAIVEKDSRQIVEKVSEIMNASCSPIQHHLKSSRKFQHSGIVNQYSQ